MECFTHDGLKNSDIHKGFPKSIHHYVIIYDLITNCLTNVRIKYKDEVLYFDNRRNWRCDQEKCVKFWLDDI